MGLRALELKLMGKYPVHLQSKWTLHLWAIPRCYRQAQGEGGTSNKERHTTGHISILSLLDGQKIKLKQISKWIHSPQNTTSRGCIESSQDCSFKWSLPNMLALWFSPRESWYSARLLFCSKTPQFHLWGEHWDQCNRTPKLRGGYLASNPNDSKQGQIQVETSLVRK